MIDSRGLRGTVDFIFMRPGESEGNKERNAQGRQPSLLTDLGREQARVAGQTMARRPPDAILPPRSGSLETAEIVAGELGGGKIGNPAGSRPETSMSWD